MLNMLNKLKIDTKKTRRLSEAGNVLFLILIAVVLFAALSYAVTQSSRSGGGGADGEANLVNSAQITQYPASVRTAIVRMIISGVDVSQLNFDPPSEFDQSTATDCESVPAPCVFHPNGGGATHVTAPAAVTASGSQGDWFFTSEYRIDNIGTNTAVTGNDIIAMLPGIGAAICQRLNTELGISGTDGDSDGVPQSSAGGTVQVPTATNNMDSNGTLGIASTPAANEILASAMLGQPFGCFDSDDGSNTSSLVYFHVLVER